MIDSVTYLSQRDVELLVDDPRQAIVSITDEGNADLPFCGAYVRLRFLDISPDVNSEFIPVSDFYLYHDGLMLPEQSVMLKMFLDKVIHSPHIDRLVVHCYHGRFRSAAVAQFVSEHYGVPCDRHISQHNEHVYKLLNDPSYVSKAP